MTDLLRQGLVITALGMGLVFAGLALLWGLLALMGALSQARLTREEREAEEATEPSVSVSLAPGAPSLSEAVAASAAPSGEVDDLTAERARVAAIAAGALLANALPLLFDVPTGPVFEHGRTAPLWVAANRARALPTWQPARRSEPGD
jgi:Na+-transporting methylmalonyl-CoA/oxaloacetate decarboxylase gamma subunit